MAREWKRADRRRDAGGGTLKGGEKGAERNNLPNSGWKLGAEVFQRKTLEILNITN
jgi:hypothetical protein